MTQPTSISDRFWPLLDAACDGTLTEDQVAELEAVLASDAAARKLFANHFQLQTDIRFLGRDERVRRLGLAKVRATFAQSLQPSQPVFMSGCVSESFYGAASFLSSGWPVAYLIATAIFAVGALIGSVSFVSHSYVSSNEEVTSNSLPIAAGHQSDVRPRAEVVGRITAAVNCRWGDASEKPASNHVAMGQKIALTSGLMEITYNTGAKVILQGPVDYVVESKNGGFMSVGKLTGKVATTDAKGFSVRTPTAIVTDVGTEFGVEVERDGTCEVHVLKGLVQADFLDGRGQHAQVVQLTEGEGRRYQQKLDRLTTIPVDRPKFQEMRNVNRDDRHQQWLTYSQGLRQDPSLVAYYPFETAGSDPWVLSNVASTGATLDGSIEGPRRTAGRLPGKVSLQFRGFDSGDKVVLPDQDRFNFAGPFSIAIWFKAGQFNEEHQVLIAKGDDTWRLQRAVEDDKLVFGTNHGPQHLVHRLTGRSGVADGQWHLAVAVYEPSGETASKRLYVDGRLDVEEAAPSSLNRNDLPVWLGNNSARSLDRAFSGWIDEVAIFARGLSADEVATMFSQGSRDAPLEKKVERQLHGEVDATIPTKQR